MTVTKQGIPVSGAWVNVSDVHPELRLRVAAICADRRLVGKVRVSSGARTYAEQLYLYNKYRFVQPGRAANPDYYNSSTGRRGSRHQIQAASYQYPGGFVRGTFAYACDIGFYGYAEWAMLRQVAATHGLRLTVFNPFEPWHFELDPNMPANKPVSTGKISFPPGPRPSLYKHMTWARRVARRPWVKAFQKFLLVRGYDLGKWGADGAFGNLTDKACRDYQRARGLRADGNCGALTWRQVDRDNG